MKITHAQIARKLTRPEMFLRHYGLLYSVTAITTDMDEANAHMLANPGEGLLAEHEGFCFIAKLADKGSEPRPLSDLAHELVREMDNASPSEITDAARMLDDLSCGFDGPASARLIARLLASVFHKRRK